MGGTPQSVLSSYCLAVALASKDGEETNPAVDAFRKLGVLRKVAQKVKESAANERPAISRPAREARDALKALDDETLQGLF